MALKVVPLNDSKNEGERRAVPPKFNILISIFFGFWTLEFGVFPGGHFKAAYFTSMSWKPKTPWK
jgi:hypothetical protein